MNIDQSPCQPHGGLFRTRMSVSYIEHPDRNGGKQDSDDQQGKFEDVVSFVLVHVSPSLIALP